MQPSSEPVIRFVHAQRTIELTPGRSWSARRDQPTYRDTSEENLRSVISRILSGEPWREVVGSVYRDSHPWLHAIVTSPLRSAFFELYPPSFGSRVLDIGSGWGQIAIPLAKRNQVTALEPTPERLAVIEAIARQEGVAYKMHFIESDLSSLLFESRFDLACCIGVMEWVPSFSPGNPRMLQLQFLKQIRALLAPGGSLVLGIENRLGLKYLLGAPDDHLGVAGVGVYDLALADAKWRAQTGGPLRVVTYSRVELEELLREAGFANCEFFGAFPDYKLPRVILPLGGAVESYCARDGYVEEHDGSNGQPLPFQEELRSHYRSLGRLGVASQFVPSFFVTAR